MTVFLSRFNMLFILSAILAVLLLLFAAPVEAQLFEDCQNGSLPANSEFCKVVNDPGNGQGLIEGKDSLAARIVNLIVLVAGAIGVIMIVIGGLRYVLSNGDPQATQSAKNTILYAIIGLIVAIAARSIVLFVVDRI